MAEIAHVTTYDAAHAETSTSFQTVASISSGSFVGSAKYLILVISRVGHDFGGTASGEWQVTHGGTAFDTSFMKYEPAQGSPVETETNYFWWTVWDQPSTAETIAFEARALDGATVWADSTRIVCVRLDADLTENDDWVFAEDDDTAAPTALTTGFVDFASKTWTPSEEDDWLFLTGAQVAPNSTTESFEVEAHLDGTNPFGVDVTMEGEDAAEVLQVPFPAWYEAALSVASHTVKVRCRNDNSAVSDHESSRVFGLRLGAFGDYGQAFTSAGVTVSTSFVEIQTLGTYSPSATANHLVFASAFMDGFASNTTVTRLQFAGTSDPAEWESEACSTSRDSTDQQPLSQMVYRQIPSTGEDVDWDAQNLTSVFARQRSIVAVSLALPEPPADVSLAALVAGKIRY